MSLHIEVKFRTLTKLDRCDRCGAAAVTQVKLPGGEELLFCGHHTAENWATIGKYPYTTMDERFASA